MVAAPRSVSMTCWTNSWLSGATSLEEAEEAIRGADTAHHLLGLPDEPEPVPLLLGLGALRKQGARSCRLAMPVPGDPLGLTGPPSFNEAALDAGEAVVMDGCELGLVPLAVGAGVQWQVSPATPNRAAPDPIGQAGADLTGALHEAIEVFAEFRRQDWSPDLAEAVNGLRSGRRRTGNRRTGTLSPGYDPRAEGLADRALNTMLIVDLAADGIADLNVHDAVTWRRVMGTLDSTSRRALVSACAPPRF